jgi:hypothetical protein
LHLGGEFAESNLGTAQERDGSLTVRVVAGQYGFTPDCTKVAVDTPVKFRLTSTDAIHGFLLPSTNVNTMVVPGFVAVVRTRFSRPGIYRMPCNEFCGNGHHGMWARVSVVPKDQFKPWHRRKGQAVYNSRRLALYHYWVAFAVFLPAVALGVWQMLMRSPLPAPLDDPNLYYASVTLHGTAMAYVVTTFFAMGFGYAVTATSLGRPIRGATAAWIGFAICLIGTLMAVAAVLSGKASVLYTFYPPLLGSTWYYGGATLLIGGSMIWVVLMVINMMAWKRDNPGQPVPLAMFATTATALLWAWAASGVELEMIGVVLPRAFGLTTQIDAGLARTVFSVTLHAIVYFWLMPAYIAFYISAASGPADASTATPWAVSPSSCFCCFPCRWGSITCSPIRRSAWASSSFSPSSRSWSPCRRF